ncbi:thiamine-binding protein [Cellulomonas sp. Leaf395]|uniref:thiamine-binding protein n=1 Tax=Cellulomonas sp. Leaf395 TaxID=1736362 RepID=UPI0012FCA6B4|nr:thiamine-binding protein [Cellulomonas sp. Leaf395]
MPGPTHRRNTVLAQIQVSPRPSGTEDDRYAYVDAAIAVIQESGLVHEVGAMGTTIQGTPDQIWPLLRAVHEATVQAGASAVSSVIKVGQGKNDAGPTIQDLVGKFRA